MNVAPEDRAISEAMQYIAAELEDRLESIAGRQMGFSLIVFNTEAGSRMNYVSNCDRTEVVNAMKSLLVGWGEGMPDIPAHKVN